MEDSKLSGEAKDAALQWLYTMGKRDELRENPGAAAIEIDLIFEALHKSGARVESRVGAIFHYLKTEMGLRYWPNAKEIQYAARELARRSGPTSEHGKGNRDKLGPDERGILYEKVLPAAKRWTENFPAGHDFHKRGLKTLEYWGEK